MSKELWDKRYAVDAYVYGECENLFLKDHFHHLPRGRVLSLGEGEGRNAVFLASKGYTVEAIDLSQKAKEKALLLASKKGVSIDYTVGDAGEFSLENPYDGAIAIFSHMPYVARVRVHRRVVQALRPGGVFLALYYTPHQVDYATGGPSAREWLVDSDNLRGELSGMEFPHLKECEMELVEGRLHTGKAHVVQCIARKANQ